MPRPLQLVLLSLGAVVAAVLVTTTAWAIVAADPRRWIIVTTTGLVFAGVGWVCLFLPLIAWQERGGHHVPAWLTVLVAGVIGAAFPALFAVLNGSDFWTERSGGLSFSLSLLAVPAAMLTAFIYVRTRDRFCGSTLEVARRRRGECPACGYDLRGEFEEGCPECGWERGKRLRDEETERRSEGEADALRRLALAKLSGFSLRRIDPRRMQSRLPPPRA